MKIDNNNGFARRSLAVASMRRMGGELSQAANSVIMHYAKLVTCQRLDVLPKGLQDKTESRAK